MTFDDLINIVYMLKLLCEINKELFFQIVDWNSMCFLYNDDYYFDTQYEMALEISDRLFRYTDCLYSERRGICINVFFQAAKEEMRRNFNFSYSLDWELRGYAKPKREYQSRLVLIAYIDEYVDVYGVAIGLLRIYRFFQEKVQELNEKLAEKEAVAA